MTESSNQKLEIDLSKIVSFFWKGRKVIIGVIVLFAVSGAIIVKTSKKYYKASCQLAMDERSENGRLNTLRGLASFAGFNLNLNGGATMSPELYPSIVNSSDFLLEVLNEPINFSSLDSAITLKTYFEGDNSRSKFSYVMKYTIRLPFTILDLFKSKSSAIGLPKKDKKIRNGVSLISKDEWAMIRRLKGLINIELDLKSMTILIEAELPDNLAAAEVTQLTLDLLKDHLTRYQAMKARDNLEFISRSYNKADSTFKSDQRKLALFIDQNKNTSNHLASIEKESLQTKYNLSYQVYMGMSSKLEEAKIKLNEQTPVFSVLDGVKVPLRKSRPKSMKIIFISAFLGFFFGTIVYFILLTFKQINFKTHFLKRKRAE